MDFSQKLKISIFWGPPRGKKTESIFELVENINQEMKLFVDFFKKRLDLSFLAPMEKKRVYFWVWKSVSPLDFWKNVRSQISEAHEKIPDSMFDLAKNLN